MSTKEQMLHRIAITAIIYTADRKYLITRRSLEENAFPGMWTVPGGQMHMDDYAKTPETYPNQWYNAVEKTLKREILEEVNLEIGKPEYLLDLALIRPDGIPVIVLSFFCPFFGGEVTLHDKDTIEFAWVTLEEAKKYDLITGIYEEIEMVENILKERKTT